MITNEAIAGVVNSLRLHARSTVVHMEPRDAQMLADVLAHVHNQLAIKQAALAISESAQASLTQELANVTHELAESVRVTMEQKKPDAIEADELAALKRSAAQQADVLVELVELVNEGAKLDLTQLEPMVTPHSHAGKCRALLARRGLKVE